MVRFTTTPPSALGAIPPESHFYNSLPKGLLEHLCPKLTTHTVHLGPGCEYVLLEHTTRDTVAWMMNWVWAGGKIVNDSNVQARSSQIPSVAVMQTLECLHLVVQLGIKGPLRSNLFTLLKGGIERTGALRAEDVGFIRSHFSGGQVLPAAGALLESSPVQGESTATATETDQLDITQLAALEQEFHPRFAHDLVDLMLRRDIQAPLAIKDHVPLNICIARTLHHRNTNRQIENMQKYRILTYSQLDFIANYTTVRSHNLLRRTICGGLVRLIETQQAGMTYWDWAAKRGWDAEMRRARKDRGAWLARCYNEEISQRGGQKTDDGMWRKAFGVHRDFWKPVYEAERNARGDVRSPPKKASDAQRRLSVKAQDYTQWRQNATRPSRQNPQLNAPAAQPPPTIPHKVHTRTETIPQLDPKVPSRESPKDAIPTSTPGRKIIPGANSSIDSTPRSKAAKKNAKRRAKKREKQQARLLDHDRVEDAGDEKAAKVDDDGGGGTTDVPALDPKDVRDADLAVLGDLIEGVKSGDWAEMEG